MSRSGDPLLQPLLQPGPTDGNVLITRPVTWYVRPCERLFAFTAGEPSEEDEVVVEVASEDSEPHNLQPQWKNSNAVANTVVVFGMTIPTYIEGREWRAILRKKAFRSRSGFCKYQLVGE
eukprot:521406-Prorocentrum_minimum.AAC.1